MPYLKQRTRKRPGIMISPNPNMLNSYSPTIFTYGNCSFKGRFMLLATVTITSVWQTQQRSQRKRVQRMGTISLKECITEYLIAVMVRQRAKRLLSSQCLSVVQIRHKRRAINGQNRYFDNFDIRSHNLSLLLSFNSVRSINQQMSKCNLAPPSQTVQMTNNQSRIVQVTDLSAFLVRQYKTIRTKHPKRGYFTICHTQPHPSLYYQVDMRSYSHYFTYWQLTFVIPQASNTDAWIEREALRSSWRITGRGIISPERLRITRRQRYGQMGAMYYTYYDIYDYVKEYGSQI